jgi:3-dehydroquinate dehydratase
MEQKKHKATNTIATQYNQQQSRKQRAATHIDLSIIARLVNNENRLIQKLHKQNQRNDTFVNSSSLHHIGINHLIHRLHLIALLSNSI